MIRPPARTAKALMHLPNRIPAYEVAGSVVIPLSCHGTGTCVSNQTDFTSLFTSINPVRDARDRRTANLVRHNGRRGVAWSDDV